MREKGGGEKERRVCEGRYRYKLAQSHKAQTVSFGGRFPRLEVPMCHRASK